MGAKIRESTTDPYHLIVVGGGAAGFFCALSAAEANPNLRILVLDGGKKVLRKVRISGGGRCNLTHHCFDPKALSERYPRGGRQLRGAFHHWQPKDTIEWFSQRGVPTKTEAEVPVLVGSPRGPVDETAAEAADMAAAMVLGDAGGTLSSGTIEYG